MGRNNAFGDVDWEDEPHFGKDNSGSEKPVAVNYTSTADIDIDKALADQYAEAEAFRDHLLNNADKHMPNHVTGAITAVNRVIEQVIKMRETVQNMARMQAFENAVTEVMKEQKDSVKNAFFKLLDEKLENLQ